jgi:hypothetical protein
MDEGRLMLLAQLVNSLETNFNSLDVAYRDSDKEKFDLSSSAILEIQQKINSIFKSL